MFWSESVVDIDNDTTDLITYMRTESLISLKTSKDPSSAMVVDICRSILILKRCRRFVDSNLNRSACWYGDRMISDSAYFRAGPGTICK